MTVEKPTLAARAGPADLGAQPECVSSETWAPQAPARLGAFGIVKAVSCRSYAGVLSPETPHRIEWLAIALPSNRSQALCGWLMGHEDWGLPSAKRVLRALFVGSAAC